MPVVYSRVFERFSSDKLIAPLEDEPSEFEKHLRFEYASRSLLGHIERTYSRSRLEFPRRILPSQRVDFDLWYSRNGTLVSTEAIHGPYNIAWERVYEKDPLFKKFGRLISPPLHRLNLSVESITDAHAEVSRLTSIFEKGCCDPAWKSHLPRLLLKTNTGNRNGS